MFIHDWFVRYFFSFGSALAMAISFFYNQSVVLAIFHGLLSWFYVAFFAYMQHS